jgi:3'(2'), 5'-bisphosphate nucleotidase
MQQINEGMFQASLAQHWWIRCVGALCLTATLVDGLSRALVSSRSVDVNALLSSCVDACVRGCHEIRDVQEERDQGSSFHVEFKDSSDPRSALTEADSRAQKAIVAALKQDWGPELRIIGEEDPKDGFLSVATNKTALRINLCSSIFKEDCDMQTLSDIIVFVDPLDGTREFVEGRLQNCQVLIGISVGGIASAGAIGIPFPTGNLDESPTVVYGKVGLGHGIIGSPLPNAHGRIPLSQPLLATGDTILPIMAEARRIVQEHFGGINCLYGGAGNKILAAALGLVDCTIQHKFGGPWDTCAPAAVLKSMGGEITDLLGEDLSVYQEGEQEQSTRRGFVATGRNSLIPHKVLVAALQESKRITTYVNC